MVSTKFGKKELSVVSCAFGALVYAVCLAVRPANVYVYVVFFTLAYIGLGFFNTIIWAMIFTILHPPFRAPPRRCCFTVPITLSVLQAPRCFPEPSFYSAGK